MSTCTQSQVDSVGEILQRVASDLSMIADRELRLEEITTELAHERPAGMGKIHISFRLGFHEGERRHHGCLLVPLPDAIALACSLMMMPEEVVSASRHVETLDEATKGALLEVGNFVAGAADGALRALGVERLKVVFEGCQGVKPDVRPAMVYQEGSPLVVGRVQAGLGEFTPDELILILPADAFSGA